MGRPRIEWTDTQLRAIMGALTALDCDFPLDNARFLDGLVESVRAATGRIYGATTYGRLLRDVAPQAGVSRRPSTPTLQAAVLRAHALDRGAVEAAAEASALMPAATRLQTAGENRRAARGTQDRAGHSSGQPMTVDTDALRGALAPLVHDLLRESVAPLYALLARREANAAADDEKGRQLQLTTVALEDAHARMRQLEKEIGELRRELGAAQAARDLAGERVNGMLADLRESIASSGRDAEALARAADRLAGTERFLKMQNDAVRLQAAAEVDALRTQNRQLRERIDHLVLDNDQYRRALAGRNIGSQGSDA